MKLDRILKKLSEAAVNDMNAMSPAELEKIIVQSENAISEALDARDENPQFRAAKQAVSDLSAGCKEVKSYQSAKIQYALIRLRELGK